MAQQETFASCLLTENCHQALVQLGDGEIKVLEHVKSYVTKHISITEQYLQSMGKLNNSSAISRPDLKENSPFMQVWDVYYADTVNVTSVLTEVTQTFHSSILGRLDKLLNYCKELQKSYKAQRFRIGSELKTACDEKERLENVYRQHGNDVKNATQKLETNKTSGKPDKGKEDKLLKSTLKLYQNHNDYVLALAATTIHQRHYQDGIIPNMMNSMQTIKYDLVTQWKRICRDMANQIKVYGEQNIKLSDHVYAALEMVKDDNPYQNFLQNTGETIQKHAGYQFDESLLTLSDTDLEPNEIGLFDLTLEQLSTKKALLQQQVTETKTKLSIKSTEYQSAKHSLQELKETSTSFESIFHDEMAVSQISRELKELSCVHEKLVAQRTLVSVPLDELNGNTPKQFTNPLLSERSDSFGSPCDQRSTHTIDGIKKQLKQVKTLLKMKPSNDAQEPDKSQSSGNCHVDSGRNTRPLPKTPDGGLPCTMGSLDDSDSADDHDDINDYDEPVDGPLEEQRWYHGSISRLDTEKLLQNDGDYLVRESNRKPGQYVVSVMWESPRHFIVQQDETGKFRLEGESFPTVMHMIDYYTKQRTPLTKKTNALLITPVQTNKNKELRHENIEVTDKLGRGHFGDVMKGRLIDTNQAVAIKTCRDSVVPGKKEKFLQEAEILGQYDHPNIVKLIGVAISKEPLYIVMELMECGDFVNYLRKHGQSIQQKQFVQFAIDAASGMTYLESKGCIHRDLAARNCLLDKKKTLKISDFGMSKETDFYECSNMREIPVKWTAPEALNYTRYTSQSDVWSFGVLLWETYSLGNTPYPGMSNKVARDQVDAGFRMPPPNGTPKAVYELMKDCWSYEPEARPRFAEILQRLQRIKSRN